MEPQAPRQPETRTVPHGIGRGADLRQPPTGSSDHPRAPSLRAVVAIVLAVSVLINVVAAAASQLWACPDTSYYVELAGGIAERGDFSNELFLVRPYGYPLFLAGMFRVFGSTSPTAILVAQHAMLVGTAALAALIAGYASRRRVVALLAGLLTACSLQLLAYGNLIITEALYTLLLTASVYFVVTYLRRGGARRAAAASLLSGFSYLVRPTGILVIPILALAVLHRAWTRRRRSTRAPHASSTLWRGFARDAMSACAPACCIVLAVMWHNTVTFGRDLSGQSSSVALYQRLMSMDRFDATHSDALTDIRAVVGEAKRRGAIAPHFDHTQWGPVWQAYEAVRDVPFAESSRIMAEAARDVIRENRRAFWMDTVRYAYWMLMVPDAFYRFQPGGAPGWTSDTGESKRDATADILSVDTYAPMLRPWLDPYRRYLPLRADVRSTTPLWTATARWFHRHIERGRSPLGLGDSPYEVFIWLCLAGIPIACVSRHRAVWLLLAGLVALHVAVSAFFAGPAARYAAPIRPLLFVFGSVSIVTIAVGVRTAAVRILTPRKPVIVSQADASRA